MDCPPGRKLHAPATARNRDPILGVLRRVFPACGTVLELASGTGEHAAYFAAGLPDLLWQPSDLAPEYLASITVRRDESGLANLLPPVFLDVRWDRWPITAVDAAYNANMIHIAPWEACEGLIAGVGRVLVAGGVLVLYGPFRIAGQHTSPGNDLFDRGLRAQDSRWGVRDLERVVEIAGRHSLDHVETVPMPANNQCIVFRKASGHERPRPPPPALPGPIDAELLPDGG